MFRDLELFYIHERMKFSDFLIYYLTVLIKFKMEISVFAAVLLSSENLFFPSILMRPQKYRVKSHQDDGAKRDFLNV